MKLQSLFCAAALLSVSLFSSCKKDDSSTPSGGSGNLAAGKGTITFNTSANFGGSTSYNGTNTTFNSASRTAGAGTHDQITITTTEISGVSSRTAQMIIEINRSLNTTNGSLNADFSNPSSADIIPILAISSTSGSTIGDAFAAESGAVTITKLSASEVEGTFSGKLVNDNNGTSINVTNGKFAGKFK